MDYLTDSVIREIVMATIKELKKADMLKNTDDVTYAEISDRLFKHYMNRDAQVEIALEELRDDLYFQIIPMYYKRQMTLEAIAERIGADVSTITRNKKRLCLQLYKIMNR